MPQSLDVLKGITGGPMISVVGAQSLERLHCPVRLIEPSVPGRLATSGMSIEKGADAGRLYEDAQALTELSSRLQSAALSAGLVEAAKSHYAWHGGKPDFRCKTCKDHQQAFKRLPSSQIPFGTWFLELPVDLHQSGLSVFFYHGERRESNGNIIIVGCDADRGEALIGFGDEGRGYINFIRAHRGQGIVAPVARHRSLLFCGLIIDWNFLHTSNSFFEGAAFKALISGALATYRSPEAGWGTMGNRLLVFEDNQKTPKKSPIMEITPDNMGSLQGGARVPFSIESTGQTTGHPLLDGGMRPAFSAVATRYWPEYGVESVLVSSIFREPLS